MPDTLGRLARRTLGLTPVLRPIVAPLFAADPGLPAGLDDTVDGRRGVAGDDVPPAGRRAAEAPGASEPVRSVQRATAGTVATPAAVGEAPAGDADRTVAPATTAPATLERPLDVRRPAPVAVEPVGPAPVRPLVPHESGAAPLPARSSTSVPGLLGAASPRVRATAAARDPERRSTGRRRGGQDPAPHITVTIGRVEVRAVRPEPAEARRAARLATPRLSLDDYVRRRREASR